MSAASLGKTCFHPFGENSQGGISYHVCVRRVLFFLSLVLITTCIATPASPPQNATLIPTLEGECVYQILHVLHSCIKLNVNQSLVYLSKWLRLLTSQNDAGRSTKNDNHLVETGEVHVLASW